jgi:hypothetical protein
MNILILSPGYPAEMPQFTRGLAEAGARVYGLGDQSPGALPELVQHHLAGYLPVRSLWDEAAVVEAVRAWPEARRLDGVECLWEPGMLLAARLREALGLRGLGVAQTVPFRDKEAMKQVLDRAGLRTPRHVRCTDTAMCWEAAERIGYPIIIKPIAGAGSADTYRVESADDLRSVLPRLHHVPEVSVEEFVDGDEFTFDTVTIRRTGRLLQRRLVSPAPAGRAQQRVDQPAGHRPAPRRPGRPRGRRPARPRRHPRARLPVGLHPHGVVSQGRRRGRVRRDRRSPARRPPGRPDELRLRLRRVPRVGPRRRVRPLRRPDRAQVQRQHDLQASPGRRPHRPHPAASSGSTASTATTSSGRTCSRSAPRAAIGATPWSRTAS